MRYSLFVIIMDIFLNSLSSKKEIDNVIRNTEDKVRCIKCLTYRL